MQIVAEIGASHAGSKDTALELIRQVRGDAVKFQTWTPDTMAVPHTIEKGPWAGRDLQDLYREAHTPWEWLPDLFSATIDAGMIPFSSPFDRPSVDILERLGCAMYKIASFEVVDLRLIDYVAQTGKPIILSCGQSSWHEINRAVWTIREHHDDITLLHCVSQYPTSMEEVNLETMRYLQDSFPQCKVGISDHSRGAVAPIVAASMGAEMIEKHVAFSTVGLDWEFAMDPHHFNQMVFMCRQAEVVMGERVPARGGELRRSLYFADDYPAGTELESEHLITRRPNLGLNPQLIDNVLGKRLKQDVKKHQPVWIGLVLGAGVG